MTEDSKKTLGNVVQIDEKRIHDHLGELVRGTVEETLNGLLDAYLHARVRHFHALEPELRIPAIRYDECFGDQFTRHDFLEFFHWCVYDHDRMATFVRG
mgnify:CR=1 FL=1